MARRVGRQAEGAMSCLPTVKMSLSALSLSPMSCSLPPVPKIAHAHVFSVFFRYKMSEITAASLGLW